MKVDLIENTEAQWILWSFSFQTWILLCKDISSIKYTLKMNLEFAF